MNPFRVAVRAALLTVIPGADSTRVYAKQRPSKMVLPCAGILWDISDAKALGGDGRTLWRFKEFQVDLWEKAEDEDGSLAEEVYEALNGVEMAGLRVKVTWANRQPDPSDANLIHTILTARYPVPVGSG